MDELEQLPPFAVRTPLAGTPAVSTVAPGASPGVILRERHAGRVLAIAALRGKSPMVRQRIGDALGLMPPAAPAIAMSQDMRIVWSGPGRWLLFASGAGSGQRTQAAAAALADDAAVSEQSSALVLLQVTGPEVRQAMAKALAIDLHPEAFPIGAAAMTPLGHVPVHVWRCADRDGQMVLEIAAPRSYAHSVWHELVEASVGSGLDAAALASR